MATKADLEAQIEELRRKVELLEAQLLIAQQQRTTVVLPAPWQGPYYPHPGYPGYPIVWCGSNTSPGAKNTLSFNARAA